MGKDIYLINSLLYFFFNKGQEYGRHMMHCKPHLSCGLFREFYFVFGK